MNYKILGKETMQFAAQLAVGKCLDRLHRKADSQKTISGTVLERELEIVSEELCLASNHMMTLYCELSKLLCGDE